MNDKISTSQLFCMLMLSRLSAEIIYPQGSSGTPLEDILALLASELVRLILALPLIVYSFHGCNIHRSVYSKNRFFGWTGVIFSVLLLFAAALRTIINLSQFSVKNLLSGGVVWIVFVIAAAFAVYSAYAGVEALGRAGAIFLFAAGIVTVTAALGDIPYITRDSFAAFTREGDFSSFVRDVFERTMRGGDYLIFAALLPYVSHNRKSSLGRTALLFLLCSTAAAAAVSVLNSLVLREMFTQCEYPFLAAASLSDISLFKRLDGFAAAVWSLGGAFRCGLMVLAAKSAVAEICRAKSQIKEGTN